ncbi:MAG: putative sporulation protein YtxC [Clostridia bacterium]|nr:putative sporulation protein YtxC [Clostridia bacterium]
MKSFCIKSNNLEIINYLLNNIKNTNFDNIYISQNKFKLYNNVVIHYTGTEICSFYNILADIITDTVVFFYEPSLIKKLLNLNYFYFDSQERNDILKIAFELINQDNNIDFKTRKENIYISTLKYLNENKSMILDGFVNFRLKEYVKTLDYCIDLAVNKFLIEREYLEFIDLLKFYINSRESKESILHLIYSKNNTILINNHKNIISIDDSIFNAKYLSDISFCENDYILNSLLTLLPEKLFIHIIDKPIDDFINTLQMIFIGKVVICKDCPICRTYSIDKIIHV